MTRYVVDAGAVRILLEHGITDPSPHHLVAPVVMRSEVLALLTREHRDGQLTTKQVREHLDTLARQSVRLLGDRVSRRRAFELAIELDVPSSVAEYLAVAQLQADALITLDDQLAAQVKQAVTLAPIDVLL